MIRILRTSLYLRSIKYLPRDAKIDEVENEIAQNPLKFPIISGTGGLRKARMTIGNRGKSSGGRIIFIYLQDDSDIYLLKAYAKNQKEELSNEDKKMLKALVDNIKE